MKKIKRKSRAQLEGELATMTEGYAALQSQYYTKAAEANRLRSSMDAVALNAIDLLELKGTVAGIMEKVRRLDIRLSKRRRGK